VLKMLHCKVVVEVPMVAAYHVGAVRCMGATSLLGCFLVPQTAS
jgi:hypothetical protein